MPGGSMIDQTQTPTLPSSRIDGLPGLSPYQHALTAPIIKIRKSATDAIQRPTLRTRSTDGLLTTRVAPKDSNEFDAVDIPSPILSPLQSGLDGLSESLARLMKQRRHSDTVQDDHQVLHFLNNDDGEKSYSDNLRSTEQHPVHALAPTVLHNQNALSSSTSSSRPLSPSPRAASTPNSSRPSTTRTSMYSSQKLSAPQMTEVMAKSSTRSSVSPATEAARQSIASTTGSSAISILRKATAEQSSAASSRTQSPFASGSSTPRTISQPGKVKPQVLETHRLQLQTHAPTGRRMINQYIIETELGRGVHGKVRLARDTETGERVAVKIVEREGKKRLGGGMAWNNRMKMTRGNDAINRGEDSEAEKAIEGENRSRARFSADTDEPIEKRHKDMERQEARKRQLWTTDKKVKREIALLKKCAHDNVVQLKEVIDDPSSKKIFMVLEFMEGGEVQWKDEKGFPTLTVDEARRTLRDVVLGLEYLHYQGIIHRDIKPANLLWDINHKVKISDFGVSHFSYALLVASGGLPSLDGDEDRMKDPSLVDDHELAKTAGSPAFFAPELCLAGESLNTNASLSSVSARIHTVAASANNTKGHSDSADFPWSQQSPTKSVYSLKKNRPPITKAIDIWALGVTLYCLLFGHVPFTADNEFALFTIIPREDYELPASMGFDRIRIGPRRKRWTSLPQWKDEEADVDCQDPEEMPPDVDSSVLTEEAKQVRDLLDQLLEKDPEKRIKLEEVKKHPWLVRDIADPPLWLSETDPAQLPSVQVSNEEVDGALTGFSRIKQTLKKFQTKIFAGLGVPPSLHSPNSTDRGDYGLHRKSQLINGGGPIRRRRSKSTSHAQQGAPLVALSQISSPSSKPSSTSSITVLQRPSPLTSLVSNDHAKSSHHHTARPHLFFRRRPSVPEAGNALLPGVEHITREISRSQPVSRPHSPALIEKELLQANRDHLEEHEKAPNRRPSALFKRGASRGDPRAALSDVIRLDESSDRVDFQDFKSRVNGSASNNTLPRSSQDLEGSRWSLVSASQSGGLTPINNHQHYVSSRPRSRSKLGDVFRNVLGNYSHAESRGSSGAGEKSRAASSSTSSSSSSHHRKEASFLPTSVVASPWKLSRTEATDKSADDQDHLVLKDQSTPRAIEVDDYDIDLDLSDDDLDEDKGRSHSLMRNDGRGWRVENDEKSVSSDGKPRGKPRSIASDHLTPSVEGGYNLFKPPYQGKRQIGAACEDEAYNESYAMTNVHSDEAEALRRASAKVGDESQHLEMGINRRHHQNTYLYNTTEGMDRSMDVSEYHQSIIGDHSAAISDDRFADADEDDSHEGDEENKEEDDDDDDGGVSFQARKRGSS